MTIVYPEGQLELELGAQSNESNKVSESQGKGYDSWLRRY